jgi:3-keto-L-gulonate-6-phosphate decarboxylase
MAAAAYYYFIKSALCCCLFAFLDGNCITVSTIFVSFFEKANADCVTVVVAANVPTASIAAIKAAANARFRFVVVLFIIKSSNSFGILFVKFVCY